MDPLTQCATSKMVVCETKPRLSTSDIDTIEDLLTVAWNYNGKAFDWFKLWRMVPALIELKEMIGMRNVKRSIIDMIQLHVQDLGIKSTMLYHTVLIGAPGTGKTTCAKILAKIYCGLGFLETENVVEAKRTDFVGKYLGHTGPKTKKLLESALGGVLFIDEAYSMGHRDKTDSFSAAAVNLLNQYLTEKGGEFICIIAGYEKELDESFFGVNPGLKSRFTRRFVVEDYTGDDILEIFKLFVKREGWKLDKMAVPKGFFTTNMKKFPYFGRDAKTLFDFCMTSHSRRIFGVEGSEKRKISREDFVKGFERFVGMSSQKNVKVNPSIQHMWT